MNGELVNGELPMEDLTILEVVEQGHRALHGPARSDETAVLARLYTEVLGLVPYELAPVAPSAGAKMRLMALVSGDETLPAAAAAAAELLRPPAPRAVPRPTQEHAVPRPTARAASLPPRMSRWPLALAAVFVLALAGLSFFLYSQVGDERATIASLRQELSRERAQSAEAMAQVNAASLAMREKFALVTSPAVLVGSMRPMGQPPLQPTARGVLFVAADHQHWYMELRGLEPVAAGKMYKLWFVADAGMVNAGSFSAEPGAPIELSSRHMPAGTKGVMVTLENDPQATAPAGPEILRSSAMITIS